MLTPYQKVCAESVKKIEDEIKVLTSISGEDTIAAWMVCDLVAKAHHQGCVDCYNTFTKLNGDNE